MTSTQATTSCSRQCRGCGYSNCKGRRSRKIGKCEYFSKYIFCCGWCFDKFFRRQSQERRPNKITRRVEHVDYLKNRSRRKEVPKTSNKNESDVYFCTVSNVVTTWPNNQRQWSYKPTLDTRDNLKDSQATQVSTEDVRAPECNDVIDASQIINSNSTYLVISTHNTRTFGQTYIAPLKRTPVFKMKKTKNLLANIFFSCLRSKQRKGAKQRNVRCKKKAFPSSARMPLKSEIMKASQDNHYFTGTTNDFSCQYSVNSNQSLEIISHVLTRSVSRLSSLESILSMKWRRRFRRFSKQPSTLQMMMYNLARKMRHKKSKRTVKHKKHNVIVLHVPKQFSNTSTLDTMSIAGNSTKSVVRIEKPLFIKDNSSHETFSVRSITKPPNKICGPGEVLVKIDKNKILRLKETGRVRHVGVSNVNEEQLTRLTKIEKPECLQIEIHVLCQQESLVAACKKFGIPVVAYSPLGSKALADTLTAKTGRKYPDLLTLPAVLHIADAHGRTPGQILLRYTIQRGIAIIPKSTNPERIKQNISLWDFELSETEMKDLAALDRGENGRICDFTFFPGVEKHPEFPFKK